MDRHHPSHSTTVRQHILFALAGFSAWTVWCWFLALTMVILGVDIEANTASFERMIRSVPLALLIGWVPTVALLVSRQTGWVRCREDVELTLAETANQGAAFAGLAMIIALVLS